MMIRWLSSELRIFAYFHNLVLLFAFLGMGLGLMMANRRIWPMVTVGLLFVFALLVSKGSYLGVFDPQAITRYLSVGTGFKVWGFEPNASLGLRLEFLTGGIMLLIAILAGLTAMFIPLGQLLGR